MIEDLKEYLKQGYEISIKFINSFYILRVLKFYDGKIYSIDSAMDNIEDTIRLKRELQAAKFKIDHEIYQDNNETRK